VATRFPDLPIYTGFNEPSRIEADVHDLEVEGEVPRGIDGSFYRVAPDPQFPPLLGKDIYFSADGMVARFRFKDGKVDFRSRYARTDRFALERAAGKSLFGAYRDPLSDDASVKGKIRGTANTNVLVHAGQLLALKEDSPALAMDPETLETKGYWDFAGTLDCPTFTAHPKLDPETGEMVAFGYAAKGLTTPDIDVFTIGADGRVTRKVSIVAPYYAMVHDFAVTRDYIVFPLVPIVGSFERLKAGLPHFGWDSARDVHIGILPRDGEAKDVRWVRGHNRFASHVMNGFNDGRKVHLDMPVAEGNMFPFFPDVSGAPFSPAKAASRLSRWTVDLSSNSDSFEETRLSEAVGEFPRIDDRYAMAPYRHGYMAVQDNS
jgi:carotenoid cleavage dioxygenase